MKEKILDAYAGYILENDHRPKTVFSFAKKLKISEEEFYKHFAAFESIENEFIKGLFEVTLKELDAEATYAAYSSREKMLALYYTWFEKLTRQRSFVKFLLEPAIKDWKLHLPGVLKGLKEVFSVRIQEMVDEAISKGEIKDRPYLKDRYTDLIWFQTLFLLHFWLKDTSPSFEKTDAAIEKTVNLAFDLLDRSPLDAALDWAKFMFNK